MLACSTVQSSGKPQVGNHSAMDYVIHQHAMHTCMHKTYTYIPLAAQTAISNASRATGKTAVAAHISPRLPPSRKAKPNGITADTHIQRMHANDCYRR